MRRVITYTVENDYDNYTIEKYLKLKGYTHNVLVHLKKTQEGIVRNDHWAYTNERLAPGDSLTIDLIETEGSGGIMPVYYPLDIVYEDEDIMVINKPADMPTHPSMGNYDNTLANALVYYFNEQDNPFTFRCINRLDRNTTGLTIIAKHSLAAGILGFDVSNRLIKRTYMAICEGYVDDEGTIDAPIARADESTIERCVDFERGEHAVTHYKRLSYNEAKDLSLVSLRLETGRTHQIRVHMKHIGHPLLGDFLYNPNFEHIKRQTLHSSSLSFIHPITKEALCFDCPLPEDMSAIIEL